MPGLFNAYLSGEARSWYGAHFGDPADRATAVRRARRPLAPAVADALEAQNARLAPSPARAAHLAALRAGAAAVVTGQQVGLFLGPLYTVYKAASAVVVARALADETGVPVVPVFWLQSEDHDLPEIAACHLPRRHDTLAVELPAAEDRVSIAHRTLPADVTGSLAELAAALAGLPHAEAHLQRLARHYRPGAGWVGAFAGVLSELFADDGLVVIDPREAALAAAVAPLHARALSQAAAIAGALAERVHALADAGYEAPVHVRPAAPLSFVHPDGPAGPRYRVEPNPSGGLVEVGGGRVHSREALLAALAAEPLYCSTSALLRPIAQDTLLPTAAYVGGPGEIAYFAQLPPLYAAYDLPMPLLVPRARFRVIDQPTHRLLARLGLTAADAARPEAELLASADGLSGFDRAAFEQALLAPFDAALADARRQLDPAAPGLDVAIEKTRATVARAVAKLAAKAAGAQAQRDAGLVEAVRTVRSRLQPNGEPQERVHGLPYYAARFGEAAFLARVRDAIEPFDPTVRDLEIYE